MPRKKIILSFDYELFFGYKSGTVRKSLIEPTNEMLDAMDQVGAKATYFVDYLMLKYLEKENDKRCNSDLELIKEQLSEILRRGHRIELHIHPHWIDAKYNGDGTWNFDDFSHYMLTSFSVDEIENMFNEGTKIINQIAREVIPNYCVVAFRAGGWALPEMDIVSSSFLRNNIKLDSSLGRGIFINDGYRIIDCTKMPAKSYYRISTDALREDVKGCFIEAPISTFKYSFFDRLVNGVYRQFHKNEMKYQCDGTHARKVVSGETPGIMEKIKRVISTKVNFYTLSHFSPLLLKNKFFHYDKDLVIIIDHPKDFSDSSIKTLLLISKSNEFTTYEQIINESNNE